MAVTDPVADFLTRIRNALKAEHRYVDVNWSKMKESLAQILKDYGFVEGFMVKKDPNHRGTIRIFLKYGRDRRSVIQGLRRISKPGLRKYVGHEDIPRFYGGTGLSILSTSKGVLAGWKATEENVGGELLCIVW